MKKAFTLFAAALLGFCAYAQEASCPSKLDFVPVAEEQPADNVQLELTLLYNNSANLNGFNLEATKTGGEWVNLGNPIIPAYFTATDYAANILAVLGLDQATAAQYLTSLCDVMSNVKDNGNLVMIEILKTNTCRFFPAVEEGSPLAIGKFALDLSGEEDGEYTLNVEALPATYSFSYTGGPEGNRAWTGDEDINVVLVKTGDVVRLKGDEPQPVEYEAFYVTGTFNDWSQDVANMVELVSNEDGTVFTGEVELTDGAEFKVVSPLEEALVWFGGEDANGVGYFEINEGLLNQPITLMDGANFKVVGDGKYTITVQNPAKGLQEPLVMTVSKEATGINTIGTDYVNGRIYDLQGRELKSVPEHGIYIQNGKKHVK
jgi:hypothetical protein